MKKLKMKPCIKCGRKTPVSYACCEWPSCGAPQIPQGDQKRAKELRRIERIEEAAWQAELNDE